MDPTWGYGSWVSIKGFQERSKGAVANWISDFPRLLHSVSLNCFSSEQYKNVPKLKQANRRQVKRGKAGGGAQTF